MRRAPFSGLTILDPDEGVFADGGSFLTRNPEITDTLLHVGAILHRHDAHDALADPELAPDIASAAAGGTVPAATTLYACFTLLDDQGGETRPSPVAMLTTPDPIAPPVNPPTAALLNDAGTLTNGTYSYVVTLLDAAGGETTPGPPIAVTRTPGPPAARIEITGLAALLVGDAVRYRVYRAKDGEVDYALLIEGIADLVNDDGSKACDCGFHPPRENTTRATNRGTVTVPGASVAGAVAWRLFVSTDGDFTSPALFGATRALGEAGAPIALEPLTFDTGAPPDVATTIGGARKIDAELETINGWVPRGQYGAAVIYDRGDVVFHANALWRANVAGGVAGREPGVHAMWSLVYQGAAAGGSLRWKDPVTAWADLPPAAGNTVGDTRLVIGDGDTRSRVAVWKKLWEPDGPLGWADVVRLPRASGPTAAATDFTELHIVGNVAAAPAGGGSSIFNVRVLQGTGGKQPVGLHAFRPLTPVAPFTQPAGPAIGGQHMIGPDGFVELRGYIEGGDGSLQHATDLGAVYRPPQDVWVSAARGDGTAITINVRANGEIWLRGHATERTYLDGVRFFAGVPPVQPDADVSFLPHPPNPYRVETGPPVAGSGLRSMLLTGCGFYQKGNQQTGELTIPLPRLDPGTEWGFRSVPANAITYEILDGPNIGQVGNLPIASSSSNLPGGLAVVRFDVPAAANNAAIRICFDVSVEESMPV